MPVDLPVIQAGTFLIAAATVFGALVGSLVQAGWKLRKERKQRRNLRTALKKEIEGMRDLKTQIEDESYSPLASPDSLMPTPIFDAHTADIGMLSEEEVSSIVKFYSSVETLRELQANQPNGNRGALRPGIESFVQTVRRHRNDAIEKISNNL